MVDGPSTSDLHVEVILRPDLAVKLIEQAAVLLSTVSSESWPDVLLAGVTMEEIQAWQRDLRELTDHA